MKLPTTSSPKRALIMAGVGVVIVAAAAVGSYFYLNQQNNQTQTPNVPDVTDNSKVNSSDQSTNQTDANSPDHTPVQTSPPANGAKPKPNELTGVVNYKQVHDGTLSIRVTIDQHISDGNCTLTLTKQSSNKTVTQTADVVANPSSATCKGFDVPTSKLSSGTWDITVKVVSGQKSGKITSQVEV